MKIEVEYYKKGQWLPGTLIHIDDDDYAHIVTETGRVKANKKVWSKKIRVIDEDYIPEGKQIQQ